MAAIVDLTVDQGSTFYRKLTRSESDGTVIDLTDYEYEMQVRKTYGGEIVADSTIAVPTIEITKIPEDGVIGIVIPAEVTALFEGRTYLYDLD